MQHSPNIWADLKILLAFSFLISCSSYSLFLCVSIYLIALVLQNPALSCWFTLLLAFDESFWTYAFIKYAFIANSEFSDSNRHSYRETAHISCGAFSIRPIFDGNCIKLKKKRTSVNGNGNFMSQDQVHVHLCTTQIYIYTMYNILYYVVAFVLLLYGSSKSFLVLLCGIQWFSILLKFLFFLSLTPRPRTDTVSVKSLIVLRFTSRFHSWCHDGVCSCVCLCVRAPVLVCVCTGCKIYLEVELEQMVISMPK